MCVVKSMVGISIRVCFSPKRKCHLGFAQPVETERHKRWVSSDEKNDCHLPQQSLSSDGSLEYDHLKLINQIFQARVPPLSFHFRISKICPGNNHQCWGYMSWVAFGAHEPIVSESLWTIGPSLHGFGRPQMSDDF